MKQQETEAYIYGVAISKLNESYIPQSLEDSSLLHFGGRTFEQAVAYFQAQKERVESGDLFADVTLYQITLKGKSKQYFDRGYDLKRIALDFKNCHFKTLASVTEYIN